MSTPEKNGWSLMKEFKSRLNFGLSPIGGGSLTSPSFAARSHPRTPGQEVMSSAEFSRSTQMFQEALRAKDAALAMLLERANRSDHLLDELRRQMANRALLSSSSNAAAFAASAPPPPPASLAEADPTEGATGETQTPSSEPAAASEEPAGDVGRNHSTLTLLEEDLRMMQGQIEALLVEKRELLSLVDSLRLENSSLRSQMELMTMRVGEEEASINQNRFLNTMLDEERQRRVDAEAKYELMAQQLKILSAKFEHQASPGALIRSVSAVGTAMGMRSPQKTPLKSPPVTSHDTREAATPS